MEILVGVGLVLLGIAVAEVIRFSRHERRVAARRHDYIEYARQQALDEMAAYRRQAEDAMLRIIMQRRRK